MNTVKFMSRSDFIKNTSLYMEGNYSIISISDTRREADEIENFLIDLGIKEDSFICVNFQDTDAADDGGIDNIIGKLIFEFIKSREDTNFIVHCFAGISRSAAVAKFINDYYDINDPVLEYYHIYNKLVFSKLNQFNCTMSLEDYYTQLERELR